MGTKIAEEGIPADDLWWLECCAGSGNILQHMPPDRRLGIDINPLAPDIRRADFFRYELDPTVPWVMLTNPFFSNDGPTRIFNRAAAQNVRLIGLVVPAHLRTDKVHWVNRLDPFYECIHDELLPKDSFLRDGKAHDVPARFQVWVRRNTRREPLHHRSKRVSQRAQRVTTEFVAVSTLLRPCGQSLGATCSTLCRSATHPICRRPTSFVRIPKQRKLANLMMSMMIALSLPK